MSLLRWFDRWSSPRGEPARTEAAHDAATAPLNESPEEIAVRNALRTVIDPELGVNIVDLGLVYGIACRDGLIDVRLTMTTPTCPLGEQVRSAARAAIQQALPSVREIHVELVWDPPWNASRMTPAVRQRFGWGPA